MTKHDIQDISNEYDLDRAIENVIFDLCQYLSDYRDDIWQSENVHSNQENTDLLTLTYQNSCMIISMLARELSIFSSAINRGADPHDALKQLASCVSIKIALQLSCKSTNYKYH